MASPDDKTQLLSPLLDIARDHSLGRDDVCVVPAVTSKSGGPAT